jgi:ubiquinone/menaquinone biosynthesis C-methylase UbiE
MFYNNLANVDFERIWKRQLRRFSHTDRNKRMQYWDKRAATFDNPKIKSSYAEDLLQRMQLNKDNSVLDIGCGNGGITIPLAKRVTCVTALDLSAEMLALLEEKASRSKITNITIINKSWSEIQYGRDVGEHDIVLASRCLSEHDLTAALQKINRIARRACYITWRAERYDEFKARIYRIMGKEYIPHPEYPIIFNILYRMGIHADIQSFVSTYAEEYQTIDQVVSSLAGGNSISSHAERKAACFYK